MTCEWWDPAPQVLTPEWEALSPEIKEQSLIFATSSLRLLTYQRIGSCPETVRICRPAERPCGCGWSPHTRGGQWYNADPCCMTSCGPVEEIDLPGPVGYIESMKIDGQPVDVWNGDWRIDNGHLLVWQGVGPCPVPPFQDLSKPDTEPGTWSITYSRSHALDYEGRAAVAVLALEFARALKNDKKCALPKGVTNVSRPGISFNIETGVFPGGLTGLQIPDAFILKWAPAGTVQRTATVMSPRSLGRVRRTGGVPSRPASGSI